MTPDADEDSDRDAGRDVDQLRGRLSDPNADRDTYDLGPEDRRAYADILNQFEVCRRVQREVQEEIPLLLDRARPLPSVRGYKIEPGDLRRGSQGVVYRAIKESTGQPVALKILQSARFLSSAARQRLAREVELVALLRHPYIVRLHDAELTGESPYLAMEWVEGEKLDEYARERFLGSPTTEILRLFERICEGVGYAHEQGVIHRDLKPANILVDRQGAPRIVDFGMGRFLREDPEAGRLTLEGEVVGTPLYMSPEQACGARDLNMRSDVYSLGVIFFEILTGRPPHVGKSLSDLLRAIEEDEPPRPSRLNREISGEVEAIILKALAKERDKRYATAGTLGDDIKRLLNGEPIEAKRDSPLYVLQKATKKLVRRVAVPAAAAGLLLSVTLVSWFVWKDVVQSREETRAKLIEEARAEMISLEPGRRQRAIEKLQEAARIRFDLDLRCEAAAALELWDTKGVAIERSEVGERRELYSVSLSPDGSLLAISTSQGVVLWSLPSGWMLTPPEGWTKAGRTGGAVAFRPDGKALAAADPSGAIVLWMIIREGSGDTAYLERSASVAEAEDFLEKIGVAETRIPAVKNLTFNPGGDLLAAVATGARSNSFRGVTVWDLSSSPTHEPARVRVRVPGALAVAFSPGDSDPARGKVALGFKDGVVEVRPIMKLDEKGVMLRSMQRDVQVIAWHPNGEEIAAGSSDGLVSLRNTVLQESYRPWPLYGFGLYGLSFSPDGDWLASAGWSGPASLIDPATGQRLVNLAFPTGGTWAWSLSASRSGRILACGASEAFTGPGLGVCEVLPPIGQWERLASLTQVEKVVFDATGRYLATLTHDWTMKVWDTHTGRELARLPGTPARWQDNSSVAFSPSGKFIAWVNDEGLAEAWEWVAEETSSPRWTWNLKAWNQEGLSPRLAFVGEDSLVVARHEQPSEGGVWRIRVYDLPFGGRATLRHDIPSPGTEVFDSAEISGGSLYVWLGPRMPPEERKLRLFDLEAGREVLAVALAGLAELPKGAGPVVRLSPGGTLVSANEGQDGENPRCRLFRVTPTALVPVRELETRQAGPTTGDGKWSVHSGDRHIELWDLDSGTQIIRFMLGPAKPTASSFSPDGTHLACGTNAGSLHCFNLPVLHRALTEIGFGW